MWGGVHDDSWLDDDEDQAVQLIWKFSGDWCSTMYVLQVLDNENEGGNDKEGKEDLLTAGDQLRDDTLVQHGPEAGKMFVKRSSSSSSTSIF